MPYPYSMYTLCGACQQYRGLSLRPDCIAFYPDDLSHVPTDGLWGSSPRGLGTSFQSWLFEAPPSKTPYRLFCNSSLVTGYAFHHRTGRREKKTARAIVLYHQMKQKGAHRASLRSFACDTTWAFSAPPILCSRHQGSPRWLCGWRPVYWVLLGGIGDCLNSCPPCKAL